MALDEAILDSVAQSKAPPTVRLYAWDPPCLSLGYSQPASDANRGELRSLGWDIIRRPTGGRAILHTDELTYSIAASEDHPLMRGGVLASYRRLRQGLVESLKAMSVTVDPETPGEPADYDRDNPVCFEVPSAYEMTVSGRKILGSAQVRRKRAVLQHGTLPLSGDMGRICRVLAYKDEAARRLAEDRVRGKAITLEQALGRRLDWVQAAEAFSKGMEIGLGVALRREEPLAIEHERALEILALLAQDPLRQRRQRTSYGG
jgi:lipoate-protein ligase A